MSATDNQPSNLNFLSPLGFKMAIKRSPTLNFFIQSVTIPSVSLGSSEVDTPFTRIPLAGTRLTFGNFQVNFKIDEDMGNYIEMFDWKKSLGFPDNFAQYQNVVASPSYAGGGTVSDISLLILTSAMNPNLEVNFVDCFPVDLSEFSEWYLCA